MIHIITVYFSANDNAVLLASDVAARGLDIPNVEHVIHYQVPQTVEVSWLLYSTSKGEADVNILLKNGEFYKNDFNFLYWEREEREYHFVSIANKSISKFTFELLSELRPQKWQNCSCHEGRIECHADLSRWCKKLSKNCPHPQQRLVSSNIPIVCSYPHIFKRLEKKYSCNIIN